MLVVQLDLGLLSKVYSHPAAQHCLAIQYAPDGYRIFSAVEADYDPAEGFEGREGVNSGMLVDGLPYALKIAGSEDFERFEIGDDERIGGWRGL